MRKTLALTALVSGLTLNSACGDTNNYYVGGSDDGKSSNNNPGKYTCQDACENLIFVCKEGGEEFFDNCLKECYDMPWRPERIDCIAVYCLQTENPSYPGCY